MTMQSSQHDAGFLSSTGGQMTALCIALAVVIAGAWFYVF